MELAPVCSNMCQPRVKYRKIGDFPPKLHPHIQLSRRPGFRLVEVPASSLEVNKMTRNAASLAPGSWRVMKTLLNA